MSNLLIEKHSKILESESLDGSFGKIESKSAMSLTARLVENQVEYMKRSSGNEFGSILRESTGLGCVNTDNIKGWHSILLKMVRRCVPNFSANGLVGVIPLTTPSAQIFSMVPTYPSKSYPNNIIGQVAPDTAYTGVSSDGTDGWDDGSGVAPSGTGPNPGGPVATDYEMDPFSAAGYTTGRAMKTIDAEGCIVPTVGFEIDEITVTAKERALKACFSSQVAHDLEVLHGMDAEAELAKIMADEVVAEINQELFRTIMHVAKLGAQETITPGTFDFSVDAQGSNLAERLKSLIFQIELEAVKIGYETRRGRGNWIIASPQIAAALSMSDVLNPYCCTVDGQQLSIDPCSGFAGTLNSRYKVYVDPWFAGNQNLTDYIVVGYKGASEQDAGLYFCPYVPVDIRKGMAECSGNDILFFRSRYGLVSNPFVVDPATGEKDHDKFVGGQNPYFRKFAVANIHG